MGFGLGVLLWARLWLSVSWVGRGFGSARRAGLGWAWGLALVGVRGFSFLCMVYIVHVFYISFMMFLGLFDLVDLLALFGLYAGIILNHWRSYQKNTAWQKTPPSPSGHCDPYSDRMF